MNSELDLHLFITFTCQHLCVGNTMRDRQIETQQKQVARQIKKQKKIKGREREMRMYVQYTQI